MLQYNPSITGSLQVTGSLVVTGNIIASGSITISGSVASASYAEFLGGLPSSSFASASFFNTVSSSYAAASASLSTRVTTLESASGSFAAQSASLSTRVTNLEATSSTVSSSFATTSGSIAGRVTCIEGQYATTGSNTFTRAQRISDVSNAIGFASTASLYTDGGLRVTKDSFVSGTAYFNNVVVYGTSSIQYITSSQLNIGTNIINLNTDTPAIRFGGLAVADSGSNAGITGSLLWDSQNNRWIYSNPSGSTYDGGMLMSGPRNTTGLGNEVGSTACAVMIGQGGDHITSSGIFSYGNATCFYGTSFISGSGEACFSSTVCSPTLASNAICSNTIFSTGSNVFGSIVTNTQRVTGSLNVSGSFTVTTNAAEFQVGATGVTLGNALTDVHQATGSLSITGSNSLFNVGCVGVGIANPVTRLHVNGNIISEGCFFSGAPDNLRIFAGHWSTVSGNGNCYLVLQAGGGSTSFGTSDGWGGTASIYTCGQTRLTVSNSGFVAIGVTPSNWCCTGHGRAIEVGCQGLGIWGRNFKEVHLTNNYYYSAATARTYAYCACASDYEQFDGAHAFYTAPYGSPGGAVSFNTRFQIFNSGIACFACQVCAPRLEMLTNSANNGLFVYSNSGATPISCTMVQINGLTNDSTGNILTLASLNAGIRMVVRNDGNVGIGTNNPQYLLEIPRGNNLYLGNLYITGCNLGPVLSSGGTGGSICLQGGGAGEGAIHLQGGTSGNGSIRFLTNSTTVRMTIANDGVSCFQNTVCAPRFVGPVTGNLTGFAILANTSCTLGGSSSDVTIYFTSGFRIEYGINDYTVFAYLAGNSAVNSSLRALIPYNYYQSSTTTTNLASYIDTPNSNSALAVAICKLGSSNTYCVAVRFAVSSGNVSGYVIQLTSNGIQSGFA